MQKLGNLSTLYVCKTVVNFCWLAYFKYVVNAYWISLKMALISYLSHKKNIYARCEWLTDVFYVNNFNFSYSKSKPENVTEMSLVKILKTMLYKDYKSKYVNLQIKW